MQKRMYLLGYMGVGKSTSAKKLGKALGLPVHDLDQILESQIGMPIADYIGQQGELAFRKLEKQAVLDSANLEGIVAVGGGTPCFYDNMAQLNRLGRTVYLHAPVGFLTKRLQDSYHAGKVRPLLAGIAPDDYAEFIGKHLMERQAFYAESQFRIAVDKEEVLGKLVEIYQTK
ncbi:MAG: shikimate kinase [Flavobacteriia bacterium]|nr:shikimate kinase [Flavobacteriia bacterium]NDD50567.1 shikimate kinase [Flavobacteriia bacterium]